MVAALGAGVDGGLGRWKREDEPASTCIDVRELEHIAEELSVCFSVGAEEDDMRPENMALRTGRFGARIRPRLGPDTTRWSKRREDRLTETAFRTGSWVAGEQGRMTRESGLNVTIERAAPTKLYPFERFFRGFGDLPPVRKLFGPATRRVLRGLKIEFFSGGSAT